MSMTKRQFHEEICAMSGDYNEAEYYASQVNEKAVNWFDDTRLAHDGYTENDAEIDRIIIDEDIPF